MADIREELGNLLKARVGLDEATAQRVVETVVEYLKEKGPSALAELGGSGLGGLLGR